MVDIKKFKEREEGFQMSQNTHKGMTGHRRPVNAANTDSRKAQTQKVIEFLKSRDEKAAK